MGSNRTNQAYILASPGSNECTRRRKRPKNQSKDHKRSKKHSSVVIWLQSKLCDWSHSHKRDFDCSQALFRPLTMTWLRTSIQQSWLWLFLTTSALQEVNTLTAIAVMTFLPFLAPVGRFFPFRPASYPKSREILHFSALKCQSWLQSWLKSKSWLRFSVKKSYDYDSVVKKNPADLSHSHD